MSETDNVDRCASCGEVVTTPPLCDNVDCKASWSNYWRTEMARGYAVPSSVREQLQDRETTAQSAPRRGSMLTQQEIHALAKTVEVGITVNIMLATALTRDLTADERRIAKINCIEFKLASETAIGILDGLERGAIEAIASSGADRLLKLCIEVIDPLMREYESFYATEEDRVAKWQTLLDLVANMHRKLGPHFKSLAAKGKELGVR